MRKNRSKSYNRVQLHLFSGSTLLFTCFFTPVNASQPSHAHTTQTPTLCNLSIEETKQTTTLEAPHKVTLSSGKKGKPSCKETSRGGFPCCLLQISQALWISISVSVPPCYSSHLHRPLSSLCPITIGKTKRQSMCCTMRPVFGGLAGIVFAS